MKNMPLIMGIVVIVVAGAAFFGGMKYQQNRGTPSAGQFTQNGGQGRFGGGRLGNGTGLRPTSGEIVSMDSSSLTVKAQDGSSKIVLLTDKTQILKTDSATKVDLKNGTMVAVFGTANSDGSISATNVQINPQLRTGTRVPSPTQAPAK